MKISKERQEMIDKIIDMMEKEGVILAENHDMSDRQKLEQLDVVLDVTKFLRDYATSIEVLRKYRAEQNYALQVKSAREEEER